MKKFLSFVLCVISSISFVMLAFFMNKPQNISNAVTIDFSENDIQNRTDIISPDANVFAGATATLNNSPYDEENKKMMDGYTITPNADANNQVNWSVGTPSYTLTVDESVYIWIYLPCSPLSNMYSLKFSIMDTTKNLNYTWSYDYSELDDLIKEATNEKRYGWMLFQLNPLTAGANSNELADANFTRLNITYKSELTDGVKINENKLSFYSFYKGNSVKNSSGILIKQKYAIYKLKDSYLSGNRVFHVNDSYKFSFSNIFEYVYVGKYDMYSYNIEGFRWQVTIKESDSKVKEINFDQEYIFEKNGWYSVNISLKERNQALNIESLVFNVSISVKCEDYSLGSFANPKYTLDIDSSLIITFKLYDGFSISNGLNVKSSDENVVEIVSYSLDEDTNTIYINVKTKKSGNVKVSVEANGIMDNTNKVASYERSCNMVVNGQNLNTNLSYVFLWVILGIYGVALVVFIVISVVKSRKFGVK